MSDLDSSVLSKSGEDEFGIYALLGIDTNLFSETAILKTAYWFTDKYFLFFSENGNSSILNVEIRPKNDESKSRLLEACGEFSNRLLDYELRQRVIAETCEIRNTLVKKAFFEAKLPLPPSVISSEENLPVSSQSYLQDEVKIG